MNCTSCGCQASAEFAFCPRCGAKLSAQCPSCGFSCAPDFAYCPKCGATLGATFEPTVHGQAAADAPGVGIQEAETDRRQVSVLFADLCGFTTLCERLDAEEVRTLQNELFAEMSAVVLDYGGYIERFVGDSLLALFGAPVAHEDDPERAVRAALDMFERAAKLSGQWEHRTGGPLALHVGINTGPAVVGSVGTGSAKAYSVTGDTANTGARLQAAAGDGVILVGPLTHRLTQHAFVYETVGNLTLKGKAQPLAAYALVGPRDVPHSTRGLESIGLTAPMVGRDEELGQLLAAFDRMVNGHAQLIRVVGEAGVGKTRLIDSFVSHLESAGKLDSVTIRKANYASIGDQPYGFLAAIVRDAYGIAPNAPLDEARAKLDAGLKRLDADDDTISQIAMLLGYVLGLESDELRHVPPEQLRRQIFLAARNLFETRMRHTPVMLIVEDLQWADAASLELLKFLADRLHDRPVMFLLSHRPELDARELANSRTAQNVLRLRHLSSKDTEKILEALFGESVSNIPEQVRNVIVDRASGIALYVEEIARGLIDEGFLVKNDGRWNFVGDASTLSVPLTIQGQLLARIDHLPADVRRLIHEASVLGTRFSREELEAVASTTADFDDNLEFLCEREILEELPQPSAGDSSAHVANSYQFTQTMIQETVYENLLVQRRSEIHTRAGNALEAACAGKPRRLEDLESLGHHFSLGQDKIKGARYLTAAGDWARDIYANEDAARHYRRALESLDGVDAYSLEALAIRERLGDLLGPAGKIEEAKGHYKAALLAFEEIGDLSAQARCLRKVAALHWEEGNRNLAREHCGKALTLLDVDKRHIELAHLYQELGRFAFRDGDNEEAIDWARKALELAEALTNGSPNEPPDPQASKEQLAAVVSHANNTLGVGLARMGRLTDAVAHVERSVAVAKANDLLQAACRGYTNLGVLYSRLEPGKAIESSLKGLEIARKIGDLGFQSRLNANLAAAYCTFTGRCEVDGVAAAQQSVELDRELGLRDHLAVPLIVLGQIFHCHGEPKRAIAYYEEAMPIAEESNEPQLLFPCYDGIAMASLDMGDDAKAEAYLQKAQSICERAALDPDDLTILPFLF